MHLLMIAYLGQDSSSLVARWRVMLVTRSPGPGRAGIGRRCGICDELLLECIQSEEPGRKSAGKPVWR
jgi:hypothetical protein